MKGNKKGRGIFLKKGNLLKSALQHPGVSTGAILGVVILGMISNGLGMLNVDTQWQLPINGSVIILAVAFDELKRRKI